MMKYVAIVNKKIEAPKLMNAIAHTALGFALKYPEEHQNIPFSQFMAEGGAKASFLTDHPFIILSSKNSSQLHKAHSEAMAKGIMYSAFFEPMSTHLSIEAQQKVVQEASLADLEYFALILYGSKDELDGITKKFSLYK